MLSYKAQRYINKEIIIFGTLALIGIIVFILGTFFNILRDEMMGICIGFIPTGVLGVILTYRMKYKPEETEKIVRIKTEERLQAIRYKSGNFTFWSVFIYISICTFLSRYILISLTMFLAITLVGMAVLYLIVSIAFHKIS